MSAACVNPRTFLAAAVPGLATECNITHITSYQQQQRSWYHASTKKALVEDETTTRNILAAEATWDAPPPAEGVAVASAA